ncbi:MAG: preprotein translocase subunit SecG [Planctomycetota bacterium]
MSLVLHYASWILFFLSSVLLIVVILLQESKGGGLSEAFGGVGAETFGVKAGGINRFTFGLAAVFCVSALVINATWNV